MTTDTIAERVGRGAMLLDTEVPGWARRIDENELDLGDCYLCILGQIYGKFKLGSRTLDLQDDDHEFLYGFDADPYATWRQQEAEYLLLATTWLLEIRARLAPGPDDAIGARNCPAHVSLVP